MTLHTSVAGQAIKLKIPTTPLLFEPDPAPMPTLPTRPVPDVPDRLLLAGAEDDPDLSSDVPEPFSNEAESDALASSFPYWVRGGNVGPEGVDPPDGPAREVVEEGPRANICSTVAYWTSGQTPPFEMAVRDHVWAKVGPLTSMLKPFSRSNFSSLSRAAGESEAVMLQRCSSASFCDSDKAIASI